MDTVEIVTLKFNQSKINSNVLNTMFYTLKFQFHFQ